MTRKNLKISMKKTGIFVLGFMMMTLLSGCQSKGNTENNSGKTEQLSTSDEAGYYLFDICSELSKNRQRDGIIDMEKSSDNLYMRIENAGMERKMAVQIFIDYTQVPILMDGQENFTYMIDADDGFAKEFCFQLGSEIDESVNHKITAIMTVCADRHEADSDDEITSDSSSIAYDMILKFDDKNKLAADELYDYEEARELYEDTYQGLLINDDLEEFKRKSPSKLLEAKPGEKIKLSYHAGGYDDCEEVLILLSLGMEQTQVNSQNFIKCKVDEGKIFNGILEITAPEKEGLYDMTGWVIKNPFSESAPEFVPLSDMPGFTIKVSE